MKKLSILILLAAVVFAGCKKETFCIGTDCISPEGIVAIDSTNGDHIYATLVNREGLSFISELVLSPEIDKEEFDRYVGFTGFGATGSKNEEERILKVYYVSEDQEYVLNDAEYINASQTTLEIVAFGDALK